MGETSKTFTSPKYGIEIKCTSKGVWYIGSLSINADTIEEFERAIDEAKRVANKNLNNLQEISGGINNEKRAENNVEGGLSKKDKPKKDNTFIIKDEDKELYEILRKKRNDLASMTQLPAYVILHNKTLANFAQKKPLTKEDMISIDGMGEKRFSSYGEDFLSEIVEYCG